MKERLLKICRWQYLYLGVLAVLFFILHLKLPLNTGDDIFFLNSLQDQTLWQYLSSRYETWTSRLIIETALIGVVRYSWLWRILDTAMVVVIAVAMSKLISAEEKRIRGLLIALLILAYPFIDISSAGWIATTVNYLWPLALGLVAMIPIKKMLLKETIFWWECPIYALSLLFAANNEQMCALLCGVYGVFLIYLWKKRLLRPLLLIQLCIALLSLIFILTCPGNDSRYISEISTWFPEYAQFSFFGKLELGFSSTLYHYVMEPNMLVLVFIVLMFVAIWTRKERSDMMLFGAGVLLICVLIFSTLGSFFEQWIPAVAEIRGALTTNGTLINPASFITWIPDLILLAISVLMLVMLYHSFDNKKLALLNVIILFSGFCSRLIMGFSPTIWASVDRTFIFMYFAIILCCVYLGLELYRHNREWFWLCCALLTPLSMLTFLTTIYRI